MTTSEPTDPNAAISGIRKSCNVYIYVNIGKAMQGKVTSFSCKNVLNVFYVIHIALKYNLNKYKKQALTFFTDGLEFFQSENGVVLSPGNKDGFILPKYFDKVINLGPNGKRK